MCAVGRCKSVKWQSSTLGPVPMDKIFLPIVSGVAVIGKDSRGVHRMLTFDGVDMAMVVHQGALAEGKQAMVGGTSTGFLGKLVRYREVETHAGGAPHAGVNAAMLGLMGVHMLRETTPGSSRLRRRSGLCGVGQGPGPNGGRSPLGPGCAGQAHPEDVETSIHAG